MYIEWSGQFEHQIVPETCSRSCSRPSMALIFIILYLTYNDFVDAVLMMMAVPEALVGGIFFLWPAQHELQRRCLGRLHRLLRHGYGDRDHHARLPT